MISRHPNGTITATSARRLAEALGPDHPSVVSWRGAAGHRVSTINNADASHRRVVAPPAKSLEASKEDMARAFLETL